MRIVDATNAKKNKRESRIVILLRDVSVGCNEKETVKPFRQEEEEGARTVRSGAAPIQK